MSISVLVVDEEAIVRGWVRAALEGSEFFLAGEAAGVDEALALWARRRPELGLVDSRLGTESGTDLVCELRRRGVTAPIVVWSAGSECGVNELARAAGAQGTIVKSPDRDELLSVLRDLHAGRSQFDARHPPRLFDPALSPREREFLGHVADGKTNSEIAAELGIGAETVKTVLLRSYGKLGTRRRAAAVARAKELGVL